jgi:hypothetical protein
MYLEHVLDIARVEGMLQSAMRGQTTRVGHGGGVAAAARQMEACS